MTEPVHESRQRALLAAVIRHLPAAAIVAEAPSGRLVAANDQVAKILRQKIDLSGRKADDVSWKAFHPDGRPYVGDDWPLVRALRGETIEREDMRVERGDGTIAVLRTSAAPVRDDDGNLIAGVVTFYDVTEELREQESLVFLAEASAIVGDALEFDETLRRIARLSIPQFADIAVVHLVGEAGLMRHEAAAADPAKRALIEEIWRRWPKASEALQRVVATGEGQLAARVPDNAYDVVEDPEERRLIKQIGIRSAMTVAMRLAGRSFGTLSFALTDERRAYDAFDLLVAEELGRRAAIAMERSRLFESERGQRIRAEGAMRQIEHLQALTAALSTAMTVEEVCDVTISRITGVVGGRAAVVGMVDRDAHELHVIRTTGVDEAMAKQYSVIPLDAEWPLAIAARTLEPVWLRSREEAGTMSPIMASIAPQESRAWASLPLVAHGHPLGVLGIVFPTEQRFTDHDRAFLLSMASQCAIALERARLFESERRAREEAENASRAKDDFLAVLSHELRTPMTTVIGWADFLKMTRGDDASLAGPIDALRASAKTQAKLVDDLLDVSRIIAGKLPISKRDTELTSIVRTAAESLRMSANEKGVALNVDADGKVPLVGDPDRLQQIVTNLVVNAIKFTPKGGRVSVCVNDLGDEAEIIVEDTGEGISPEFLPHVFDRFRQASSGDSRRHTGLGLGLSIVQHLAQLHGGNVHAQSEGLGKGATFIVTIPTRGSKETGATPSSL